MHTGNISSFWGTAQIIDDDHVLIKRLMPPNYKAKSEQAFLFHVIAGTPTVRSISHNVSTQAM